MCLSWGSLPFTATGGTNSMSSGLSLCVPAVSSNTSTFGHYKYIVQDGYSFIPSVSSIGTDAATRAA